MDRLSLSRRSWAMSRVRRSNTKPELEVRRLLFAKGYRYRLHAKQLPGTPDLVFASRRKVIFVNGCFWHRHENCRLASTPKSNTEFWLSKFEANKQRDQRALTELSKLGWSVLTVWQCEIDSKALLERRLCAFLEN